MDEQTERVIAYHLTELDEAALKIEAATEDRNETIRQALLAGLPASAVAKAVGLTRQRVWQIARATGDIRLS